MLCFTEPNSALYNAICPASKTSAAFCPSLGRITASAPASITACAALIPAPPCAAAAGFSMYVSFSVSVSKIRKYGARPNVTQILLLILFSSIGIAIFIKNLFSVSPRLRISFTCYPENRHENASVLLISRHGNLPHLLPLFPQPTYKSSSRLPQKYQPHSVRTAP